MSGGDALFYAFALVALGAALSSALRHDLHRAARSLKTAGIGVTGLLALAGASLAASLLGAVVIAGHAMLGRAQSTDDNAAGRDAVPGGRVRASLLVLAFLVIVARVVLMVRWPVVSTAAGAQGATWIPPVGLPHYLLAALALLCVGLFAAITRRSGAGIGMGVALMQAAAAVAIAAAAAFSDGGSDARLLAAALIVLAAVGATAAVRVGNRYDDFAHDSAAAQGVATGISVVLAGVTFALLAGSW